MLKVIPINIAAYPWLKIFLKSIEAPRAVRARPNRIEINFSSITKNSIHFSLSKKYKSINERKVANKIKPTTKSGIELNILTKIDLEVLWGGYPIY